MGKRDTYRQTLRSLATWDDYLLAESGLPGPRGNLELAAAVADEGDAACFAHLRAAGAASLGSPLEFLAFCGTLGLGKLLAQGQGEPLDELRLLASEPRWRVRESVAMALQRWGAADMAAVLVCLEDWATGNRYEQRAVVAALCEPSLLREPAAARATLALLDRVTATLVGGGDAKSESFRVLRQALGYGWSVAVVALPASGKPLFERWLQHADANVRWVMRENLGKARLARMDAAWVADCLARSHS